MAITASNLLYSSLPKKPSDENGPKINLPISKFLFIIGTIIFSSSFPITPLSPQWGLYPKTAILGLLIKKSLS